MKYLCLSIILLSLATSCCFANTTVTASEPCTAYLMAHFGPEEKLYYAWSRDARNWNALNDEKPVFDPGVRLRDPFVKRVNGKFHLVHTKGWDHPTIFHWESIDLINWVGGAIDVVPPDRKRAWAPEFFYDEIAKLFYVYWASIYNGHNTMHMVTTRDWTDITPDRSQVFYDLGIHDIDLTIIKFNGFYYGFHKPGDVDDRMGNRLSISRTLDPITNTFAEGRPGKDVLEGQSKPTEGPEVIRLIGQNTWYIYGDPFHGPMEAWETSDFIKFKKIAIQTVPGSKHCSMLAITETELHRLLAAYPSETTVSSVEIILPHTKQKTGTWHYKLDQPSADWFKSDFDDTQWKTGEGGFGTEATPNTKIGTLWNTEEIWLRRTFSIDSEIVGNLYLQLHHDEDTTVFLNGRKAATVTLWNTDYDLIPVRDEAANSIQPGRNTIAVHCRQTTGGQYIDVGLVALEENRWTRKTAWNWFNNQPWPCGFNYIPANAISYTEMWMPYCFDPEFIDKELALAETVGFNCLRVVLPFVVWEYDPAAFKNRLDVFLKICDIHGLKVMFALFDDCVFGPITDPVYGKQPDVVKGWYANGWTPSPGHSMVRDPKTWPRLEKYVKDIIHTFKDDPRVWVWDLYNEPTNGGLGNVSLPLVTKVFTWAREIYPMQPLTIGQFNGNGKLNEIIHRNSDIITFHNYNPADNLLRQIESLKKHGRPIINTEWLNRGRDSNVETCLPIFAKEKVGCLHWGLVNGKTQTHLHWGWRPGKGEPNVWQHDIFRSDGIPYRPEEISLFRAHIPIKK
ncbi:MAG: cellulase family glycosylhydrolase [Sedimentisphaerales bacterium]|nr:cellulase family glycosylhydrolase [Sedimentisphaerales bacterium]